MTLTHFELIAEVIRTLDDGSPTARRYADAFARRLAATNPSFNRARFLRACGVAE